ncbi:trp operon leader peptide [Salmonella enterica subsp. enterica]|nr:trp operon leader peptide [Salmonella enterica subsp. enterica]EAX2273102.1 trp operon leader peptide [Salmonella enterica]EBY6723186.1 trp operon leader peptide [Salmonella enterica subsp. enterica serovar Ndolo]ECD5353438.1 trp operon leader peptide [Salmonella enterica subsp. enterica serovar Telaviv]EDS3104305.1 trp operon leader peptide [Salmonella enterica subsp. enterica serovar Cullingworth]HBM0001341.1 trp operon leader peptide [Salmonella enterica subsp. enterica serovar Gozo]HEC
MAATFSLHGWWRTS